MGFINNLRKEIGLYRYKDGTSVNVNNWSCSRNVKIFEFFIEISEIPYKLAKEFTSGKVIDFYSGKELDPNDISIDHVIPWSFMYSDDIWNLVITSKSNNSSKSNTIPSEEVIKRLKERNEKLLNILEGKYKDDLKMSIENNYLEKFFYECRL